MKKVTLALLAVASLVLTTAPAVAYDFKMAVEAAGKALAKVPKATEFNFYNIPPGAKANPEVILRFMLDCRKAGHAGAIGSEKVNDIYKVVEAALTKAKDEKLDGLVLIIVAATTNPKKFDDLLLPRGIIPIYASYKQGG